MNDQKWLTPAWFARYMDALAETVGGPDERKVEMIQFLFDAGFWDATKLSFPAAVSRFNACLNPGRAEFFKLGEVFALMRRFDRHELFHAIAADLGYQVERIPTDARRLRALERIATALERRNELLEASAEETADALAELQREQSAGHALRIHPALSEPGAAFSFGAHEDVHGNHHGYPSGVI